MNFYCSPCQRYEPCEACSPTPQKGTSVEVIDRALWSCLRPSGDPVELTVTVRGSDVDIEGDEGNVQVSVYAYDDGVDVRIANLQVFVKGNRVSLVQAHPPYPISAWTVLWEGEMVAGPSAAALTPTGSSGGSA